MRLRNRGGDLPYDEAMIVPQRSFQRDGLWYAENVRVRSRESSHTSKRDGSDVQS